MSSTKAFLRRGTHTVLNIEVNYLWGVDGVLKVWVNDCDDLYFENILRAIKFAIKYWRDEEHARRKEE